ncbi:unnamed protein product [Rotaria magnacalcarata]|uniref:Uncharacterized protein n=1 Tax=Rotaria magnacalcarata TaxID=392030 RepID=A0A814ZAI6_9BILA|nr:unnamed protein product [Rotaria magnacalcarata]CAF1241016.1 unnamed protein product [Rotaria magnacalcarata]CAF1902984.1 unnamed protein product [Rotaria magnacalcarata]CAF1939657.1 unnamed protein product [Rotaria magnacalcarata]CAF2069403.1 unnamed protein product [Rotaria magnacalcarata]
MNNHTKPLPPFGLFVAMGYLPSIFSLLFILILILITLFILFMKHKSSHAFDEHEIRSEESASANELKSLEFYRSKQYSSTSNNQQQTSMTSFQIDIDEQTTCSTTDLLSRK